MSISRRNFSFQHKQSELQPHIWRSHKIMRHSFSAWFKINDVNARFFFCYFVLGVGTSLCCLRFYAFSAVNYVRKPSQNSAHTINEIWPWNRDFQGQGCLREFLKYFLRIQRVKLHRNTLWKKPSWQMRLIFYIAVKQILNNAASSNF